MCDFLLVSVFQMAFTSKTYVPPVDEMEEASWQPEYDFLHAIGQRFSVSVPLIAQTAMQKVLKMPGNCARPGDYKIKDTFNSIILPPKYCEKCKCVQVSYEFQKMIVEFRTVCLRKQSKSSFKIKYTSNAGPEVL